MSRCLALAGFVLLVRLPILAQNAAVRIRVTDLSGAAVPHATVTLTNAWNRTVGALTTNDGGDITWSNLPKGGWYFYVSASGFYSSRLAVRVCNAREQVAAIQLRKSFEQDNEITVDSTSALLDTMQMPDCDDLDLPQMDALPPAQSKPAKHHWWLISR